MDVGLSQQHIVAHLRLDGLSRRDHHAKGMRMRRRAAPQHADHTHRLPADIEQRRGRAGKLMVAGAEVFRTTGLPG